MESRNPSFIKQYIEDMSKKYERNTSKINSETPDTSKTKKRTYEESFGVREYDVERYGQGIDDKFFQTNIGHGSIG